MTEYKDQQEVAELQQLAPELLEHDGVIHNHLITLIDVYDSLWCVTEYKDQQEVAELYQQLAPELLELDGAIHNHLWCVTEYKDQHHPGQQGYHGLVASFS